MQWLAIAEEERGAIWNLSSGQRLYNLKTFKGAYFSPEGLYIDFPKQEKVDRSIAKLNLQQPGITLAVKLGQGELHDVGPYLLAWKTNTDQDKEDEKTMERFNRYRYEGSRFRFEDITEIPRQHETLEVRETRTGGAFSADSSVR